MLKELLIQGLEAVSGLGPGKQNCGNEPGITYQQSVRCHMAFTPTVDKRDRVYRRVRKANGWWAGSTTTNPFGRSGIPLQTFAKKWELLETRASTTGNRTEVRSSRWHRKG